MIDEVTTINGQFTYQSPLGIALYSVRRGDVTEYRVPGEDWQHGLACSRRVPFRFPHVVAAIKQRRPVVLVETEFIADAFALAGAAATALVEGLDVWCDDYAHAFSGADVVVVRGPDGGDGVVAHLSRVARRVRVLDLGAMRMFAPVGADR